MDQMQVPEVGSGKCSSEPLHSRKWREFHNWLTNC